MTDYNYKSCTGCALICEDILYADKEAVPQARNICRKGQAHYQSLFAERTKPMIEGRDASMEQAITRAAEILKDARSPLIYGWSNSSSEAQAVGMDLAERIGAAVDDPSTYCEGLFMEMVLAGKVPSCTLDDVRNFADTSIFWGSDPSSSQPRHLSRFSYFPRGEKRQKSYEEERTCIVVDVRESPTARLCPETTYRVGPGEDLQFLEAILNVLEGKIPKFGDKKKMIELGSILKKTEYGVIFPGRGMLQSLQGKMELFLELMAQLNEVTTFKAIPVARGFNTRGFNQLLLDRTGFVKSVSFQHDKGEILHRPEDTLAGAAKRADALLALGSDPLAELPVGVARALAKVPIVAIESCRSITSDAALVVIPSAISGPEAGGTAIRTDGMKVSLEPFMKTDRLAEEQILTRIMEAM
jgi:formylmethanofuran dehydrogenase subunit B